MAILNWITYRICEEATEEYKSGKARGLKVTLTFKHNYDLCFSLIYYPVELLWWRACLWEVCPILFVVGFADDDSE